jgi:hypothetical protein
VTLARKAVARVGLCLVLIAIVSTMVAGCGDSDSTPKVSWNSPSQGSEVFGIARLKISASSNEGISEVKFYCDSVDDQHLIGTVANPTDSLYTQMFPPLCFISPDIVLSVNPMFKTVSIIPGIDMAAPERTETRRGLFKSPNFLFDRSST